MPTVSLVPHPPIANSTVCVLATGMAPAPRKRRNDRCIVRARRVLGAGKRARLCRPAADVDDVLYDNWQTVQRPRRHTSTAQRITAAGLGKRGFTEHGNDGFQPGLVRVDRIQGILNCQLHTLHAVAVALMTLSLLEVLHGGALMGI